jgi:hypothetical protein
VRIAADTRANALAWQWPGARRKAGFHSLFAAAAPIDKGGGPSYVSATAPPVARGACGCEKTRKRRFSVHLDHQLGSWCTGLRRDAFRAAGAAAPLRAGLAIGPGFRAARRRRPLH